MIVLEALTNPKVDETGYRQTTGAIQKKTDEAAEQLALKDTIRREEKIAQSN